MVDETINILGVFLINGKTKNQKPKVKGGTDHLPDGVRGETDQVLDAMFYRPIFQTSDFVERSGIPKQTAMPLLRTLKDNVLLTTLREASGRRPAILVFSQLLNIAEGKDVF